MNNDRYHAPDPEDMFAETRMSFGDHIEELRHHLWRAIHGFVIAMVLSLFVGKYVVEFIKAPVEKELQEFYDRVSKRKDDALPKLDMRARLMRITVRVERESMREILGLPPLPRPVLGEMMFGFERMLDDLELARLLERDNLRDTQWAEMPMVLNDPAFDKAIRETAREVRGRHLTTLNITEAFFVYFKVSMLTGFVLASPWIFYQVWSFIAAGLYPHEKRLVNVYLPFSIGLFLAGVFLCQFFVIPRAVEALLWFNEWLGLDPDLRLSEWLSFAIMMPLVFGISFQTPLVMLFFFKLGILDVEIYRNKRRMAWFVMAVVAALITPTVDAFSMLFLWVPMGLLYELGIGLCIWSGREEFESPEESRQDELVEV